MRLELWLLDTDGASNGNALVYDAAADEWKPGTPTSSLTVQDENVNVTTAVTQIDFQGAGVTATAGTGEVVVTIPGTGNRETLMASGVSFPADPLESSSGGDWLYGEAP